MAIYRLLQNAGFTPEQIKIMATAYEGTLIALALKDRNDPITEMIAKKIIAHAECGERDPNRLREHVMNEIASK
jgi:hypothetical protein